MEAVGIHAALGSTRLPRLSPPPATPDPGEEASAVLRFRSIDRFESRRPGIQTEPATPATPPQTLPPTPSKGESRPAAGPVSAPPSSPAAPSARTAAPPTLIPRIVEAATLAPTLPGNRIRIALSPAHLGELLIELTFQGSLLQGSIRTESEAARELIVSQLDQLRASLEGQGIRVGEFQVNVEGSFRSAPEASVASGGAGERPLLSEAAERPRSARRQLLDLEA